jgi:hypothetical protein
MKRFVLNGRTCSNARRTFLAALAAAIFVSAGGPLEAERPGSGSAIRGRSSPGFIFTGSVGIEIIAQVFNIFNATNPAYYNGRRMIFDDNGNAIPNPDFGKPQAYAGDTHQGEQRLLQLAARVHF